MKHVLALFLLIIGVNAQAQMPQLRRVVERYVGQEESPPLTIPTPPAERVFRLQNADETEYRGDEVRLKGNVRFRFRDFQVSCDEAQGNVKTEVFLLKGNVFVEGPGLNYEGKQVLVNFKEKTAQFVSAQSVVKPELVKNGLAGDIFIRGESGSGSETRYALDRGTCTTCDLEEPHYHLSARSIEVMPEDRIILRDARLVVLGATILRLPYMSIPLNYRAPRYIPETGQSPDEGYFIKTRFGVGLPGDDLLDARVDYMTKLGFGLGGDFSYLSPGIRGELDAYTLIGPRPSSTVNLNHQQSIGSATLSTIANYSNRNYLTSPNNTLVSARNLVTVPFLGGQTRVGFNYSSNKSNSFRTVSQNLLLADARTWGSGLRTAIDLNLSSYSSQSGTFNQDRRVLEVNGRASKRFSSMDAELAYQRTVPISEIVNFFSATDQTPMLTLRSDTSRLFGNGKRTGFYLLTDFSVGELIDAVKREPVGRASLELIMPQQTVRSGGLTWNVAGRFKQGVYSDDTAQFIFGADSNLNLALNAGSSVNVRYNYLRPQGYTPLNVDRTGRTDLFGADVAFKLGNAVTVAAQSGYDLLAKDRNLASPWQSVGTRIEWVPSENFTLRTSATYDTFSRLWNSVRVDSTLVRGSTKFYVGARYDGARHTWGAINFIGEGLRWGRLTTSLLLSFNGYTSKFESRQFSFTYDMHCTEALLEIIDNQTGFRNGTSVAFYIRLKALPFATPFGRGTRGQGFGTGTGIDF